MPAERGGQVHGWEWGGSKGRLMQMPSAAAAVAAPLTNHPPPCELHSAAPGGHTRLLPKALCSCCTHLPRPAVDHINPQPGMVVSARRQQRRQPPLAEGCIGRLQAAAGRCRRLGGGGGLAGGLGANACPGGCSQISSQGFQGFRLHEQAPRSSCAAATGPSAQQTQGPLQQGHQGCARGLPAASARNRLKFDEVFQQEGEEAWAGMMGQTPRTGDGASGPAAAFLLPVRQGDPALPIHAGSAPTRLPVWPVRQAMKGTSSASSSVDLQGPREGRGLSAAGQTAAMRCGVGKAGGFLHPGSAGPQGLGWLCWRLGGTWRAGNEVQVLRCWHGRWVPAPEALQTLRAWDDPAGGREAAGRPSGASHRSAALT